MITSKIFRAYDIRGVFEKDFDLQGAEAIGKGYGSYLIKTSNNPEHPLRVCVGRDGRVHSEKIQEAFMRGLATTGIQVVDIGLSFSPLLFFAICEGRFDGGVNITASHNPKEYNGFKLQREDAHAICGEEIQEILNIIETHNFVVSEDIFDIEYDNFWQLYKNKILDISQHPQKAKIVVDAGNGVTGHFAPQLFRKLGYDVVELYCEVDGNFPHHQPDPEDPKNLHDLQKKVLDSNAQFGIAFDGDGDRTGIVDAEGKIYTADYILLLLARDIFTRHTNAAVVYTVTNSSLIKEEIESHGGIAIESKVGHSFVEEKMREANALIGGESSGHFFFAENYYGFDDGLLAAVKVLEIVLQSKKPLKEHFIHLPEIYTSEEIKFEVDDDQKFKLIDTIKSHLIEKYQCCTIDGVKVYFDKNTWGICRASNTSPKISIRCEARTQTALEDSLQKMQKFVEEAMQGMHR